MELFPHNALSEGCISFLNVLQSINGFYGRATVIFQNIPLALQAYDYRKG
jgi:hypothetical protein